MCKVVKISDYVLCLLHVEGSFCDNSFSNRSFTSASHLDSVRNVLGLFFFFSCSHINNAITSTTIIPVAFLTFNLVRLCFRMRTRRFIDTFSNRFFFSACPLYEIASFANFFNREEIGTLSRLKHMLTCALSS